jgi:hypothetical protein
MNMHSYGAARLNPFAFLFLSTYQRGSDHMPSWITYIVILVAFAATLYCLYAAERRVESFEVTEAIEDDKEVKEDANDIVGPYIETLESLPRAAAIKYYLSSFSAGTKYDPGFAPFRASETKWFDHFNRQVNFTLIGTLPSMSILNTGLPMKGIKMVGPPSEALGGVSSYELPGFTYMMYGKMNTIVFENNQPITLFQIYAENPNHISLVLYPKDNVMVKVELTLGNVNRVYQWSVPRSTLLSNGNKTLYTLVYEKLESGTKAYFYIGDSQFSATISNNTAIKLGNSPMDVNSDTSLDLTLWNMSVFTAALTREEIKRWSDYFNVQSTGLASNLDAALAAFDAVTNDAVTQLSIQDENVKILQEELNKCKATMPTPENLFQLGKAKWHIKLDDVINKPSITGEESASCSILNLQQRAATGTTATGTPATGTGTTATAAGTTATETLATGTTTTAPAGGTTTTGTAATDITATSTSALQTLLSRFHINVPGTEKAEPKATADTFTNPARK